MTISEQLRFSILSAPVAAADRRALSQAWYSALYRQPLKQSPAPSPARRGCGGACIAPRVCVRPHAQPPVNGGARQSLKHEPVCPRGAVERRAPQLDIARKIGELAATRTRKRVAATFIIDASGARVRVLVAANGAKVRLIAICAKKLEATVAAALAQARYAAASGALQLHAQTVEDRKC